VEVAMKLYFMSAIIQDKSGEKPCLLAMSEGDLSLEKAMEKIDFAKKYYIVLSAWVDSFDENNKKETVFHECYINAFGDLDG
jgi:hypothetical protein